MKLQFKIIFKSGTKVVAEVDGRPDLVDAGNLTLADVTDNVIRTEQFLERLTGLRVHIEQVQ